MFIGYPFGKKGWKVYDIETGEVFVSRDVIFHEAVFPSIIQKEAGKNACTHIFFDSGTVDDGDAAISAAQLEQHHSDADGLLNLLSNQSRTRNSPPPMVAICVGLKNFPTSMRTGGPMMVLRCLGFSNCLRACGQGERGWASYVQVFRTV